MRYFFLVALALMVSIYTLNARQESTLELTQSEIYEAIEQSKPANPHIADANRIFPGDSIIFLFRDGYSLTHVVSAGESQWSILESEVHPLVSIHGPFAVDLGNGFSWVKPTGPVKAYQEPIEESESSMTWYIWLLLAALAAYGLYQIWSIFFGKATTAGPPMLQGGIREGEQMPERLREAYMANYGSIPRNVTRGFISTRGILPVPINYGDGEMRLRRLNRERGFRGTLEDGTVAYVIGDCANGFNFQGNVFNGNNILFESEMSDNPVVDLTPEETVHENIVVAEIDPADYLRANIELARFFAEMGGDVEFDLKKDGTIKTTFRSGASSDHTFENRRTQREHEHKN